jgi:hypothetical protein
METSFVAECFWPDVTDADLDALDRRVTEAAGALDVRYLGSILLREDEVVLCQFDGPADSVRAVAERARVPFERILHATSTTRKEHDDASEGGARLLY